jgi:hypothetical protein
VAVTPHPSPLRKAPAVAAEVTAEARTLRLLGAMMQLTAEWPGKLVLAPGPKHPTTPSQRSSSVASFGPAISIAGAAGLLIDADAAAMKHALRRGEIDFLVTSLDEALRTLKNELRQHRPLAVGVSAPVADVLAEAEARGLQPDLIVCFQPAAFEPGTFEPGTFEPGTFEPGTFEPATFAAAAEVTAAPPYPGIAGFQAHGAALLSVEADGSSQPYRDFLNERGLQEVTLDATEEKLPVAATASADSAALRLWRERAPQYLRSAARGVTVTWREI